MSYEEKEMTNETYEQEYTGPIENTPVEELPTPKPVKSNLATGLVGAFLGALIGCALWILIWKLGYIAGIAGFVIGVCALKGYEKFGKTLDIKGAIVTVILMIVMIFLANKVAWSWDAYDVLKEYDDWTFFEVFQNLDYIIEESELTGDYLKDLLIGYLLTGFASFKLIIEAFRSAIRK